MRRDALRLCLVAFCMRNVGTQCATHLVRPIDLSSDATPNEPSALKYARRDATTGNQALAGESKEIKSISSEILFSARIYRSESGCDELGDGKSKSFRQILLHVFFL